MEYTIEIYLLLLSLIIYWHSRTILHPAFITSCTWFLLVSGYIWIDHGLYPISDITYIAIGLWSSFFCFFAYIFGRIKVPELRILNAKSINPFFLRRGFLFFYCITLILLIIFQYKFGSSVNPENSLAGMREVLLDDEVEMPLYFRLLNRLETFIYVLFWGTVLTDVKKQKLPILWLGTLLLVYTFMLATKGKILELFFTFIAIALFNRQLKLRYIVLGLILVIPIILFIALARDDSDYSLTELLIMYTLSPLTALDTGLTYSAFKPTTDMSNTFKFFYTVAETLKLDISPLNQGNAVDGWLTVPIPTNVYTIMYTYYKDLGWFGIISMGTAMGAFWGIVFNLARRNIKPFILMYAIMYYMLIFQFFGDWFFFMLSMNLQIIFYCMLIYLRFKRYRIQTNNELQ